MSSLLGDVSKTSATGVISGLTDNGIILIDKPANLTSFGVVARLRRVLRQHYGRKIKVGHTGTLDPFATGLMILVVGPACKQAATYTAHDKQYQARFVLGRTSTTGDPEGTITDHPGTVPPSRQQVDQALAQFVGRVAQRPPVFSAIKVDGQRAYRLARDGKAVELPLRTITIHQLELVAYQYPYVSVRAHVSSGTYIRSLAVDLGQALGTGAYCDQLRRTKVADWSVDQAQRLTDFGIID